MYKKHLGMIIFIVLILSGCTKINNNLDNVVNSVLNNGNIKSNTVSTNYKLYLPIGVMQLKDNEYNQELKIKDNKVFLYVDTVSYYYKNKMNYNNNSDYSYYYKDIENGNKSGFIGINKISDDLFYCDIFYNYAKIEFYSNKNNLEVVLANSLIVIKSIEYNDTLIKMVYGDEASSGRDIKYQLDKPEDATSTFSDFLQEYVSEEEEEIELPDSE